MWSIVITIGLFVFCMFVMIPAYITIQDNTNKKLQIIIATLTSENIELEKKLEEYKQTVKTLQKLYHVSDKTLDLHTLKSGYPSTLVDEHFNELKNK